MGTKPLHVPLKCDSYIETVGYERRLLITHPQSSYLVQEVSASQPWLCWKESFLAKQIPLPPTLLLAHLKTYGEGKYGMKEVLSLACLWLPGAICPQQTSSSSPWSSGCGHCCTVHVNAAALRGTKEVSSLSFQPLARQTLNAGVPPAHTCWNSRQSLRAPTRRGCWCTARAPRLESAWEGRGTASGNSLILRCPFPASALLPLPRSVSCCV